MQQYYGVCYRIIALFLKLKSADPCMYGPELFTCQVPLGFQCQQQSGCCSAPSTHAAGMTVACESGIRLAAQFLCLTWTIPVQRTCFPAN